MFAVAERNGDALESELKRLYWEASRRWVDLGGADPARADIAEVIEASRRMASAAQTWRNYLSGDQRTQAACVSAQDLRMKSVNLAVQSRRLRRDVQALRQDFFLTLHTTRKSWEQIELITNRLLSKPVSPSPIGNTTEAPTQSREAAEAS